MVEVREPPFRLCCGQQHWGPVCPDGRIMCQLCFERKYKHDLYVDDNQITWDICAQCHAQEVEMIQKIGKCVCTECCGCKEGWCDTCTPDIDNAGHSRLCPLREQAV